MRDLVQFCKFIYRLRRTPRQWSLGWSKLLRLPSERGMFAYADCPLTAVYAPSANGAIAHTVGVRAGFSERTASIIMDAADYTEFDHTPSPRLCSIIRRLLLWATQPKGA